MLLITMARELLYKLQIKQISRVYVGTVVWSQGTIFVKDCPGALCSPATPVVRRVRKATDLGFNQDGRVAFFVI